MSRIFLPLSTRTRSIAPRLPPASPIARARSANAPGRSSRWTRSVALNDAEGRGWLMPSMVVTPAGKIAAREAARRLRADPRVRADAGGRPPHAAARAGAADRGALGACAYALAARAPLRLRQRRREDRPPLRPLLRDRRSRRARARVLRGGRAPRRRGSSRRRVR